MKLGHLFLAVFFLGFAIVSCSSDDDTSSTVQGDFQNGILISHEGGFSGVSGSTSYISEDFSKTENRIYNTVNGEEVGIFQQSIAFTDDQAFIVVDNTNTITAVNRYTFEKIGAITTGLQTPRYMTFADGKGYVTNWGDTASPDDDFIAVVDLNSYEVINTIAVSEGPEQIVSKNGFLYVSHKGGFGTNDVVSIIKKADNSIKEVEVGDNPDELAFDTQGNLWVLAGGKTVFDENFTIIEQTPGALVKINTTANEIETTISFSGTDQPSLMDYENGVIYYTVNGALYALDENENKLPAESIGIQGSFYGMNIKDGKLYVVDAKDFASNGALMVYDIETKEVIQSLEVGVVPAKIYFN